MIIPVILAVTLVASLATFVLRGETAKRFALAASLVPLAYGLWALRRAPIATDTMIDQVSYPWITAIGSSLTFGVDGISAPMIFLTGLLTTLVIWFSWDVKDRAHAYFGLMLLLEFALIGVFTALDYFVFYIFWDIVLIPMFFLILLWGGPNRRYAAVKFFAYTFITSLVMLLGIMALYFQAGLGSFDMAAIARQAPLLDRGVQTLIFAAFLVGFGTKMPIVPVHTWLPDAHVQAPTGGSVMLAGVLLKMGAYGFLRLAFPAVPEGAVELQPLMLVLAVVSMVYIAFVALGQRDLKSMIAYSSISHMGAVLLGFATFTHLGLVGGQYMMFAHGLISPALFMGAGVIQHHFGTRLIPELGGIARLMPKGTAIIMVAFFASLGLPGLAGFVAEFLIFLATYKAFGLWLLVAVLAVPLTAGFYLWAAQRSFFGPVNLRFGGPSEPTHGAHGVGAHGSTGHATAHGHWEIAAYEFWPIFILMALALLYGVYPLLLTDMLNTGSENVLSAMGVDFQHAVTGVVE